MDAANTKASQEEAAKQEGAVHQALEEAASALLGASAQAVHDAQQRGELSQEVRGLLNHNAQTLSGLPSVQKAEENHEVVSQLARVLQQLGQGLASTGRKGNDMPSWAQLAEKRVPPTLPKDMDCWSWHSHPGNQPLVVDHLPTLEVSQHRDEDVTGQLCDKHLFNQEATERQKRNYHACWFKAKQGCCTMPHTDRCMQERPLHTVIAVSQGSHTIVAWKQQDCHESELLQKDREEWPQFLQSIPSLVAVSMGGGDVLVMGPNVVHMVVTTADKLMFTVHFAVGSAEEDASKKKVAETLLNLHPEMLDNPTRGSRTLASDRKHGPMMVQTRQKAKTEAATAFWNVMWLHEVCDQITRHVAVEETVLFAYRLTCNWRGKGVKGIMPIWWRVSVSQHQLAVLIDKGVQPQHVNLRPDRKGGLPHWTPGKDALHLFNSNDVPTTDGAFNGVSFSNA